MRTISVSSASSDRLRLTAACLCCAALLSGCFRSITTDDPETAPETDAVTTAPPAVSSERIESVTAAPQTDETSPPTDPDSYFTGSLFIGDSILEGISKYVRAQRGEGKKLLSDARFLTDLSGIRLADLVGDVTENRILYTYKGKPAELGDIIADMKPTRIFLMLGMNDLAWGYTAEETAERLGRLIDALKKQFPDTPITVMTVTPKIAGQYLPWYCRNPEFGSTLLNSLAEMQITLCGEKKIPCADTGAALRDEKGNLPADYCRDGYVHLSDAGAAVLVDALAKFAEQETGKP